MQEWHFGLQGAAAPLQLQLNCIGDGQNTIKNTLSGFTVSLAAADTAPAARAWAGYRDAWRPDRGGHATPGVRIAGPATRDPRIISPDATSARLDGLPIESLDLDPDTLEALRAVNVRLIGELRRLPRIALPARATAQLVV